MAGWLELGRVTHQWPGVVQPLTAELFVRLNVEISMVQLSQIVTVPHQSPLLTTDRVPEEVAVVTAKYKITNMFYARPKQIA